MNTGSKLYLSILFFYSFSTVILFAEEPSKPELISVKENSTIRYYGGDIGFIYEVLMNAIYLTQDTHGILEIKSMHMNLGSTKRKVMEIKSARSFDIAPLPAMIQPDEELVMIPFPIHQGMFGVRVLIAHQDSIQALESCMTLDDLKRFTFGHGKDWSDTAILQHNQIPVVLGDSAQNLYHMLLKKRFDCFPRAIEEVNTEKQRYGLIDTKPVESFYVYYPYIVCYFVSRENQAFADRLLEGLKQSFHDGSYQKILHYFYQEELVQVTQQKKRVIHLENPFLSEQSLQLVQTYMMPELKSLLEKE